MTFKMSLCGFESVLNWSFLDRTDDSHDNVRLKILYNIILFTE